jgi:hypothetical protein
MLDIATHGDQYEQIAYQLFIRDKFPAYETFWQNFIVPLTNRPVDIHTKSDQELALQFSNETKVQIHERIAVMQLHYSVLRMLIKAYDKRKFAGTDMSAVEDSFSYLYSALDIAAELLGRYGWYKLLVKFGLKEQLEHAKTKLTKQGLNAVIFSYWEPNLASITATAAGVLDFSFRIFSLYSLSGVILWSVFWGAIIFVLGDSALQLIGLKWVLIIFAGWICVLLVKKYWFSKTSGSI